MHKITVLIESGNANNGYPTGLKYEREFEPGDNPRFWGDDARRAMRRLAADINVSLERYVDLREGPELPTDHPLRHRILSVIAGHWLKPGENPAAATNSVLHELQGDLLTPEREADIRAEVLRTAVTDLLATGAHEDLCDYGPPGTCTCALGEHYRWLSARADGLREDGADRG